MSTETRRYPEGLTIGELAEQLKTPNDYAPIHRRDDPATRKLNWLAKANGAVIVAAALGILHNHSPSARVDEPLGVRISVGDGEIGPGPDRSLISATTTMQDALSLGGTLRYMRGELRAEDGQDCVTNPVIAAQDGKTYWGALYHWGDTAMVVDTAPTPLTLSLLSDGAQLTSIMIPGPDQAAQIIDQQQIGRRHDC